MIKYFLVLGILVHANNLTERIAEKRRGLPNQAGAAVFELSDEDLDEIITNRTETWFILYYDAQLKSSELTSASFNLLARKVFETGPALFGKVNLRKHKKSFWKLKLGKHPTAVWVEDHHYYNYTGPLDLQSMKAVVLNKTYLNYEKHPLPGGLSLFHQNYPLALSILLVSCLLLGWGYVFLANRSKNQRVKEE